MMLSNLTMIIIFVTAVTTVLTVVGLLIYKSHQNSMTTFSNGSMQNQLISYLNNIQADLKLQLSEIKNNLLEKTHQLAKDTHEREVQHLTTMQKNLQESISSYEKNVTGNVEKFTNNAETKLHNISNQVSEQLNNGFQKTNETFTNIVKRLAIIDNTQQKLTNLSENIVTLQHLLADKRSRGAFGEVQLKNLIDNMLPTKNVSYQHTLSNDLRCDCILFLPEPIGNLVIDAKFPLESYHAWTKLEASQHEQMQALRQFRHDVKKHIQDIANKYIITNETADGAIMFIPAEAIFAEIHSNLPEIVTFAHEQHVWLASPTTMMAILTTASAVLKDSDTKKHIHIIQDHIRALAKDFTRFDERMQKLTKHIEQARKDVHQVNSSAKKISCKFTKIEKAELQIENNGNE